VAVGLPGSGSRADWDSCAEWDSCDGGDSLEEIPTAAAMIKTTSADRVQERRSESSRLCMGALSALGGFPHCDRDHRSPGSPH
jgi:hypothetical protein